MYDPIFSKSFNRSQRKRFGCCAIFLCFIIALPISFNLKKPPLHHFSLIGDAMKMHLSINAGTSGNINPINAVTNIQAKYFSDAAQNKLITSTYFNNASKMMKVHAIECRNFLNYCEVEGDIRTESSSIVVVTQNSTKSWSVEPYPRTGTSHVKNWTVSLVQHYEEDENVSINIPKCTQHHTPPAVLFSLGGFTGNFFHDFADVLFPLYLTSSHFKGEVQFLVTDYKQWWIEKFRHILNKFTRYKVLDIDGETSQVHCFKKLQIGLKFHKELITQLNPNPNRNPNSPSTPSMHDFRQRLREAYSLERKRVRKGDHEARPRLMIISRRRTRVITNEGGVTKMARKMGFQVVVAEAGTSTNLSKFARDVNSCDVLVGVHGAGLTNMVFLPDNAVLIQVIPFGGVDGFARLDFGNPSAGMKLRYLEYKIGVRESSLSQRYSAHHPVLTSPDSYKSWNQVRSIYLNEQNVSVDLSRFKGTLVKTLQLLRHP